MENKDAKAIVTEYFDKIQNKKSESELSEILVELEKILKIEFDTSKYPKLTFSISIEEIETLKSENKIDNKLDLELDISQKITDPLTKILYALAWKNGDLQKIKHIINGIIESNNEDDPSKQGLVFNQFGKHLTDRNNQPIIDQHTIRAFAVFKAETDDDKAISEARKIKLINNEQISDYKKWIKTYLEKVNSEESKSEILYYVDKILFLIGRKIKN